MTTKKILITGTSSGFGLLSAANLASRGHQIIAALRGGADRLNKVTTELPQEQSNAVMNAIRSGQITGVDIEMTDKKSFQSVHELIQSKWNGHLDVLINNAGMGVFGPFELITESDLRYQMEVNYFGLIFLTQELLPLLRKSKGTIINISSIAGLMGFPFYSSYNASKFAIEGMSESLYYEMKDHQVKVALIEPGGFKTSFTKKVRAGAQSHSSHPVYGHKIQAMRRFLEKRAVQSAADPKAVVHLITKLSESKNPSLHNVIGNDAKLLIWLKTLLPDFIVHKMIHRMFQTLFKNREN